MLPPVTLNTSIGYIYACNGFTLITLEKSQTLWKIKYNANAQNKFTAYISEHEPHLGQWTELPRVHRLFPEHGYGMDCQWLGVPIVCHLYTPPT